MCERIQQSVNGYKIEVIYPTGYGEINSYLHGLCDVDFETMVSALRLRRDVMDRNNGQFNSELLLQYMRDLEEEEGNDRNGSV